MTRQPSPRTSAASSQPPSTWAAIAATPPATPYQATARGRSRGSNSEVIVPRTWGTIIEPASPCASRAPMSSAEVPASPHSSEAAAKAATPMMNMRR
jgi:hypothetical protein